MKRSNSIRSVDPLILPPARDGVERGEHPLHEIISLNFRQSSDFLHLRRPFYRRRRAFFSSRTGLVVPRGGVDQLRLTADRHQHIGVRIISRGFVEFEPLREIQIS
jgi:hypothetical protein